MHQYHASVPDAADATTETRSQTQMPLYVHHVPGGGAECLALSIGLAVMAPACAIALAACCHACITCGPHASMSTKDTRLSVILDG